MAECNIGIICSCMPACAALLKHYSTSLTLRSVRTRLHTLAFSSLNSDPSSTSPSPPRMQNPKVPYLRDVLEPDRLVFPSSEEGKGYAGGGDGQSLQGHVIEQDLEFGTGDALWSGIDSASPTLRNDLETGRMGQVGKVRTLFPDRSA